MGHLPKVTSIDYTFPKFRSYHTILSPQLSMGYLKKVFGGAWGLRLFKAGLKHRLDYIYRNMLTDGFDFCPVTIFGNEILVLFEICVV